MNLIKPLSFLLISLFLCSCNTTTAPQETDEEAFTAVESVVQDLFDDVWAGYDENAVTKYQTDDFLLLEHGEVWNNDTIINWCKEAQTRNSGYERINNFKRIEAKRNGNKVWLAYHNYGTFKKDTIQFERGWLESVVAVKLDTIWKLELMHSTRQPVE